LVYQEAQATQVSQASVDRLACKVLRELLDRLVQLAVLDYKDVLETLALLVHTHGHLWDFFVFASFYCFSYIQVYEILKLLVGMRLYTTRSEMSV